MYFSTQVFCTTACKKTRLSRSEAARCHALTCSVVLPHLHFRSSSPQCTANNLKKYKHVFIREYGKSP